MESGAKHWELGEEVDVWLFGLGEEVFCPGEGIRNGFVDTGDIDCLKGDVVVP